MSSDKEAESNVAHPTNRVRNAIIFIIVAGLWLAFDIATKQVMNAYTPGDHIAGPFLGLFQFTLVHNTGAAWGIFGGATMPLVIISAVVVVLLLLFLFKVEPNASVVQAVSIGLVCAGGIGNAIDRIMQGYVVDFIETTFIDFPVFNIADIGVTCGIILLLITIVVSLMKESKGESN